MQCWALSWHSKLRGTSDGKVAPSSSFLRMNNLSVNLKVHLESIRWSLWQTLKMLIDMFLQPIACIEATSHSMQVFHFSSIPCNFPKAKIQIHDKSVSLHLSLHQNFDLYYRHNLWLWNIHTFLLFAIDLGECWRRCTVWKVSSRHGCLCITLIIFINFF